MLPPFINTVESGIALLKLPLVVTAAEVPPEVGDPLLPPQAAKVAISLIPPTLSEYCAFRFPTG